MTGRFVVDVSVAVKWYVPEEGSAAENTQMVTADSRFYTALAATPLAPFVSLLGA